MAGDGTVTSGNFASQLLQSLGLPNTPAYQTVINQWVASEGGYNAPLAQLTHNPLNARCNYQRARLGAVSYFLYGLDQAAGATGCTTQGFVIYPNLGSAVQAYTAQLHEPQYKAIPVATSPAALKSAIIASPWAAGHYNHGSSWAGGTAQPSGEPQPSSGGTTPPGSGLDLNPFDALGGIWSGITGAIGNAALILMGGLLILLGVWSLLKQQSVGQTVNQAGSVLVEPTGALLGYAAGRQRRLSSPGFAFKDAPAAPEPSVSAEEAITEEAPPSPSATPPMADSNASRASNITIIHRGTRKPETPPFNRIDFIAALQRANKRIG